MLCVGGASVLCGGREGVVCVGMRGVVCVWVCVGERVIEKGRWGWGEEEVYIAHLIYIINTLNRSHDYSEI